MTRAALPRDLPALLAADLQTDFPPGASRRVGVALSGGGDSTALLHIARAAGLEVAAATVDHGLRAESRAEAEAVGAACAAIGIDHKILFWDGKAAQGNVMDAGRRARLALLGSWARDAGLGHVLLGHTADDEAETFLMRLSRTAGLEGLSGMRRRFIEGGTVWHRPLLEVTRAELRDWLRARGIGWIDDPSNDNPRFARVRTRIALRALAPAGVSATAIARSVAHLAEAERAFGAILSDWTATHGREIAGALLFEASAFDRLDRELRRRLITAALQWVAGADYAPRAAKTAALLERLAAHGSLRATLHDCRIIRDADGLLIAREPNTVAQAVHAACDGQSVTWAGWSLTPEDVEPACAVTVGALGPQAPRCKDPATGIGLRAAYAVSPAIRVGERLISAPLLALGAGWKARNLRGSFTTVAFRR